MLQRLRWLLVATGIALPAAALYACNSEQSIPPIDTSGRLGGGLASGAAEEDAGTDAAVSCFGVDAGCNDLQLCGPQAFLTQVASNPPASVGGAISSGLYELTGFKLYTGTSGASGTSDATWFKQTMELLPVTSADGGVVDAGAAADGGAGISYSFAWTNAISSNSAAQVNENGSIEASGTTFSLEFDFSCGNAATTAGTYTATSTSLVVYLVTVGVGTSEYTYTLIP